MGRRSLDFRDADAVIAEIRRLQGGGYTMLGKWTLTQMCEHLTSTFRVGLDGVDRRLPWLFRKLVGEPMARHVTRTRRMISGVPAPREVVPTAPGGPDDPALIDACIATIERARDATSLPRPHPMADLTVAQWKELNWVHCAHHLGFLVPRDGLAAPAGAAATGQSA
ncbi:DUF1569 domain-containing protein [Tautonia plasticadhaerens]|uniref:DinB superfamily protein n=1 Tax=Tautonia plasticadhaerens TaxID=2527974 RepID=A0A518GXW5_9BACT|nr:DUF1569 domain-containing protein [Tautonia plasticadhaerens]QDV33403.1 hypothetical protein ElP_12740 [Tautonia plasticadhaerens]